MIVNDNVVPNLLKLWSSVTSKSYTKLCNANSSSTDTVKVVLFALSNWFSSTFITTALVTTGESLVPLILKETVFASEVNPDESVAV